MENKIPQKTFDSQLHIIRDPRFDVDKYKVGELYVINNTLRNIIDDVKPLLFQKSKIIGLLQNVDDTSLTFRIICIHQDPQYISIYEWNDITLSIDTIIDHRIEIERLLTETEATMYLSTIVLNESKQKAFEELTCSEDIEHKKLDPTDPEFNKLLGIVPDTSQFPYTLENTKSYQELDAAYKKEFDTNEDSNIDRNNYICHFSFRERPISFINDNGTFAHELFNGYNDGSFKVTMTKGDSIISMRISVKNFKADADTITFRNGNNTISITLHKDSFYKIFDNIKFEL